MKPWVKSWEVWAATRPDAVALINAQGQEHSFSDLCLRAWSLEHRMRIFGLDAGDRLSLALERSQPLDEWAVGLWAAGLRKATCTPSWSGFTKRELSLWEMDKAFPPRLRLEASLGDERVFDLPGAPTHDIAFVWPERSLEGGDRASAPMVPRKLSDDQLSHAVQRFIETTGLGRDDVLVIMDGGLSGLSWLAFISGMVVGAKIVQCPRSLPPYGDAFDAFLCRVDASWVCASAEWLTRAAPPGSHALKGIIAPWGRALPLLRRQWASTARWIEAWCPASCGWWWGACEVGVQGDEPSLTACAENIEWRLDGACRHLWVKSDDEWLPVARVWKSAHAVELARSGVVDGQAHPLSEKVVHMLRDYTRFGDVCGGQVNGEPYIAVLPRCRDENPQHVLAEASLRAHGHFGDQVRCYKWIVAGSVIPRDECGVFNPARLHELR